MTNSKWEFSCDEWLNLLNDEIDAVTMINTIAHKINQTIINNDNLSKDSDLWSWIDDSFIKNVVSRIWRIVEQKSCEKYEKTDANFHKFLQQLKEDSSCILSEERYTHYYDNVDIGPFLETQQEERKAEYINLLNNQTIEDMLKKDLKKIKKIREKIKPFRDYGIAHLKMPKITKDIDYNLKYGYITDSISCLQELIAKYKNLILATRINFNLPYHYGNVFDIPWKDKEQEKLWK